MPPSTPQFPLTLSPNRRYLVDQAGQPFFYHAETAWRMPQRLDRAAIIEYLSDRKAKGFNAIHLHAISKEKEGPVNIFGAPPFDPLEDVTRPNEEYWRNIDQVLETSTQFGFLLVVSTSWFGYQGTGWRKNLNPESARRYGRFLGKRYSQFNNMIWILGGDNNPGDQLDSIRSMAEALKEIAPHHLLTYHGQPEYPSAEFFRQDTWLDIDLAYTYQEAYRLIRQEYMGPAPVRPVILGETGYEDESNTGFPWSPLLVRRQPYWAILSGAAGSAYGSKLIWWFGNGWRDHLNKPGVSCMPHVYHLFNPRQWWELAPDFDHTFLKDGYGDSRGYHLESAREDPVGSQAGQLPGLYATAARTPDGRLGMVYIPNARRIQVNLGCLAEKVRADWYDPTNGRFIPVQEFHEGDRGLQNYNPPKTNSAGDSDWVLVFEG